MIDLKPENIVFRADKKLKFFAFGLAACVRKKVFANEVYKMMAYVVPVTSSQAIQREGGHQQLHGDLASFCDRKTRQCTWRKLLRVAYDREMFRKT